MTLAEIEEKVKSYLIDEFEIDEEDITPDATLKEDLGIDSLDFVDIVVMVKRTFNFRIEKKEMGDVKTFREFCMFIDKKINN